MTQNALFTRSFHLSAKVLLCCITTEKEGLGTNIVTDYGEGPTNVIMSRQIKEEKRISGL